MKKLLFVVNDANFFVSHRLPLALAAQQKGFDVSIAAAGAEQHKVIKENGLKGYHLALQRSGVNVIAELIAIAKVLRDVKPDVVHLVTIKPVLLGGLALRWCKVESVVYAISGLGHIFTNNRFLGRIKRSIILQWYRLALAHNNSRVIFQNDDDKALFIKHRLLLEPQALIIRGGSGVDLGEFYPQKKSSTGQLNNKPVQILLPARMLKDKGVYEFVYAAQIIMKKGINAKFLLAGGLDKANPARLSQAEMNAFVGVHWLGQQKNMNALYNEVDIVCLPSYREGLPKALIEACACAKPIVTTDVPGCRDVVEDGKNGYLVPIKSVTSLVDALLTLIEDAQLRAAFGQYSRQKAEREFAIEEVVRHTLTVYGELVKL